MPEPSTDHATASADGALPTHYAYKASLIGSAHQFELTEAGLAWQVGAKSGVWPYADIALVRLSYRPVSMQSHRFRADIELRDRQRLSVVSTTWQTVALMSPQNREYRAFIAELHERMKRAGSRAVLTGGVKPGLYAAGIVVLALVAISVTGLLARALATRNTAARCSCSASPPCSAGRSAASSGATGRSPTRSITCRRNCCRGTSSTESPAAHASRGLAGVFQPSERKASSA